MRRLDLSVGEEVRRLRLDAGVSLAALSGVVGVHRTYLARIEAGRA
jgi:transcriptional regulator with XRE-family HTH domain